MLIIGKLVQDFISKNLMENKEYAKLLTQIIYFSVGHKYEIDMINLIKIVLI